jgi:hypothetical protein
MANQIVVLSTTVNPVDSSFNASGVFWLVVPTNNVVPYPGFKSQVPFIDQVTLGQLRLGTLLEQAFTSGLFASGTTLATVQASLETQYTTAQTALNNAASPLSGLIATEYTGSAWVAETTGLVVFDPVDKLVADVSWAAAAGLIPGLTTGRATGYITTSSSTRAGIFGTTYIPQVSNKSCSLQSSSAADASGGAGAIQVTLNGLSSAFVSVSEVLTLNGTSAVNTVNQYAYMESMVVTQVGTEGGFNDGVISLYNATGGSGGSGSVWGSIAISPTGANLAGTASVTNGSPTVTFTTAQTLAAGQPLYFSSNLGVAYYVSTATSSSTTATLTANWAGSTASGLTVTLGLGDGQTFWAHHYVPTGVTCYILSMEGGAFANAGTLYLGHSNNPSYTNQPMLQIGPTMLHPGGDSREHDFQVALAVPGPDHIVLFTKPQASTTDTSLGTFEYLQF